MCETSSNKSLIKDFIWQQESRLPPNWIEPNPNPKPQTNSNSFSNSDYEIFLKTILPNFIRHIEKKKNLIKKSSAL